MGGGPPGRVVACDDGHVGKLGSGSTIIACVLWEGGPVDLAVTPVRVDGLEASSLVAWAAARLSYRGPLSAVLLDSLTIAGFNVVSPGIVSEASGAPVIVVYKYRPSSRRLREALEKHFPDWKVRMRVLALVDRAARVETGRGEVYVIAWKTPLERARAIVEALQVHARIPEPLRLAHIIASEASLTLAARTPQPGLQGYWSRPGLSPRREA